MKKRMLVVALAVAVLGSAVAISAISNMHRSPSHWRSAASLSAM